MIDPALILGLERVIKFHEEEATNWLQKGGPGPASIHRNYVGILTATLSALAQAPAAPPTCEWALADEDNNAWETACGHAFTFAVDGPVENLQKFCGYCGLPLHVAVPRPASAGREGKE